MTCGDLLVARKLRNQATHRLRRDIGLVATLELLTGR